jgi:ElaB/YqjD/DUF883 family membrane-anchored ribosome-binding protein
MAKEPDLNTPAPDQDWDRLSTEDIRHAMADTRQSITDKLFTFENEVEQRVLYTIDEAGQRIIRATDDVRQSLNEFREKANVSRQVRQHPYRSVSIAAGLGLLIGRLNSRRREPLRLNSGAANPSAASYGPAPAYPAPAHHPWKDAFAGLAAHAAQQLLQFGLQQIAASRQMPSRNPHPDEREPDQPATSP